ncbi:MAG: hypothetical protein ACOYJJ_06090 [Anaerovoracaceae bacterium]|jgi:hypothetical protein
MNRMTISHRAKIVTAVITCLALLMSTFLTVGTADESYASSKTIKPKITVSRNKVTVKWNKLPGSYRYTVQGKLYHSKKLKNLKTTKKTSYTFRTKYEVLYSVKILAKKGNRTIASKVISFDTGSSSKADADRVVALPTMKSGIDRIDAIDFVGDDIWYLKSTSGTKTYLTLSCVKNATKRKGTYSATASKQYYIKNENGTKYKGDHGCSMAYVGGYFYILANDMDYPILKVSKTGVIKSKIKTSGFLSTQTPISAISYYGKDADGNLQFICRDGRQKTESGTSAYQKFSVGTLKGDTLTRNFTYLTTDKVSLKTRCNDIYYDPSTTKLYRTMFNYDSDGKSITKSRVKVYTLSSSTDESGSYRDLDCDKTVNVYLYKHNTTNDRFEVEGVSMYNGKLYLGINNHPIQDGLYRAKI